MSDSAAAVPTLSEVQQKLAEIVAREAMVDIGKVKPETKLEELEIQSADYVMILMDIEEVFGVYISVDSDMTSMTTVNDFTRLVMRALEQRDTDQSEDQPS
ncbi:MAG: phosphopantetheine-binding protein [Mesorhizobium sp.]